MAVPVIYRLGGINILLRSREDDRHEPHFHVKCAERSASIGISTGFVYASTLTGQELRDVLAWANTHVAGLRAAWDEIQAGRSPGPIEP